MTPKSAQPQAAGAVAVSAGGAPESLADGVFIGRGFLSPFAMLKVLGALDRLSASWSPSQRLGLLGRGQTGQIRPTSIAAQAQLDEIRHALAPAALEWAERCGFTFAQAPHLQLFPVRMVGDTNSPAFQEPHVDSNTRQLGPPTCTNVFYARAQGIAGGDLAVTQRQTPDLTNPIVVQPSVNSIVSFAGDRVHWVQPLYAGERLSVVINFY